MDEMRIDDLAQQSGTPSTTIRLYQTKGILGPPRLEGRTGYYGPAHLARLRLVAQLQERGFSLAAIKALIDARESGLDLADLLGGDEEVVLDIGELMTRFPADTIGPAEMQRVAQLGLADVLDDGRVRVRDRRFLDTGAALVRLGVPVADVLDEFEVLTAQTDAIAHRFVALFERHFYEQGAADLDELRTLAAQVLVASLDASLTRTGAQRLAEELSKSD